MFKNLDVMIDKALGQIYNAKFTTYITELSDSEGNKLSYHTDAFYFRDILEKENLITYNGESVMLTRFGYDIVEKEGGWLKHIEPKEPKIKDKLIKSLLNYLDSDCVSPANFSVMQGITEISFGMDYKKLCSYLIIMESKGLIRFPIAGNNTYAILTAKGLAIKEFDEELPSNTHSVSNYTDNRQTHIGGSVGQFNQDSRFENSPIKAKAEATPIKKENTSIVARFLKLISENPLVVSILTIILTAIGVYFGWIKKP